MQKTPARKLGEKVASSPFTPARVYAGAISASAGVRGYAEAFRAVLSGS